MALIVIKVEIENWWKNNCQEVTEVTGEKSSPSTTMSITNPTRPAQTLPGSRNSYIPEGPTQVEFCANRK
jgi:hypothetical protein